MKTMKNKLRSQSGASLMLALLFLLFCVLIGGTVLAAASANGFRVTRVSDKQQELEEHSAARLIADQLDADGKKFSLEIITTASPIQAILTLPEGVTCTPMHRLTAEMAVCKYLTENGITGDVNLICGGTTTSMSDFWYKHDTSSSDLTGTLKLSGTDLVNKEVELEMKGSGSYSLMVDFGEDSHVSVQMKADFTAQEGGNPLVSWSSPQIKKEG